MDICYPPDTDWSCRFSVAEIIEKRADDVEGPLIAKSEAFAWSLLAAMTAYRIGTCPITVRPCALGCLPAGSYREAPVGNGSTLGLPTATIGRFSPFISGGLWYNGCGCFTGGDCSCSSISEVLLPGPVGAIVEVKLDGEVLPRSEYRVDNGNRLVRQGDESWPVCQDMSLDEAAFSVTYYRGAAPNAMTRAAAGALAAEFYASCKGDDCRLPGNVTRASRGGENYEFEPTSYPEGKTGIAEVDAVITIYNPYGLKTAPVVLSPDSGRTRTRTW